MTRRTMFQKRLPKQKDLFIPFITAGDPTPEVTVELAVTLFEEGASVIELGVPYSDPLADGPVIQEASKRALKQGMTLQRAIELVPAIRERGVTIPVVLFTYYNPVHQFGEEKLLDKLVANEIDGLLIPDLPFEESESLQSNCLEKGIELISLVAPTSRERIQKIAKNARGFLYCVSSLGVTGERKTFDEKVNEFLSDVKSHANIPVAVGFGISSPEQVRQFKDKCDGVIVGSALIRKIASLQEDLLDEETREDALDAFRFYVRSLVTPLSEGVKS